MGILLPALNRAREQGKRIVCLNNLKQLTLAWMTYASAYNDKLVSAYSIYPGDNCPAGSGCTGENAATAPGPPSFPVTDNVYVYHKNEIPWIGPAYETIDGLPSDACQRCAIRTGALWRFNQNEKIYRCPMGKKRCLITYDIVDSMNGKWWFSGAPPAFLIKTMNQIKGASKRFVFLDDGYPSPDSYAVFYYRGDQWIDPPMARHGNGTDVSYADGHAGRLMWQSPETVKTANKEPVVFFWQIPANNCAAMNDLYKMQVGVWGKIGYTPTVPSGCKLSSED